MTDRSTTGFRDAATGGSQYTALAFLIRQQLGKVRTATIVQVLAVSNDGGVSPVGTVDVQPLVHQTDGAGNITALPPVYGVPYVRVQGGTNAVILDPQAGDLGIALFGDRDLSTVVATKDAAAPGSNRRNSLADALYIGGLLNGTPVQYVRFSAEGIELVSPTKVHIQAPSIQADASTQFIVTSPDIQLHGAVHITGAQTNDGAITAQGEVTGNGKQLSTHKHTGVTTGGGVSGPPQ
jgi:phage baseplate assembly protein V